METVNVPELIRLLEEVTEAYRILRIAYFHDMHREEPPMSDLQIRIRKALQAAPRPARRA